jgi:hypothetical protein
MEENNKTTSDTVEPPDGIKYLPEGEVNQQSKAPVIIAITLTVVIIGLLIWGAVFLFTSDADVTSQIRDVFIIFMALESLVIGIALVILIIQIAVLTNLLQNEIKPILDTTNETVNTLRGTVQFIGDNLAEPVIKLNEYLAALKKFMDIVRPKRR